MSADNGIYILKTGKQYRVKECFAIDRLYYNESINTISHWIQPKAIVKLFGDCPYTKDANQAIRIANRLQQNDSLIEYGITILDAHKSWRDIVEEAQ